MMINSHVTMFALLGGGVRDIELGFGLERKESSNEDSKALLSL